MSRVIVLGGLGQFGRTAAVQLRSLGIAVQTASRDLRSDIHVDANDGASLRTAFRPNDLVIDAAGPFHGRSAALVEAAIDVGFDVIDINDDLRYAKAILAMQPRIDTAGIRVLSSASSVSAVAATIVRQSGITTPVRVSAFLAPASRHTANAGAARSLIRSVGQPIRVFRDGKLQTAIGWSESRSFRLPAPAGSICGRLFECADSVYLPRIWPTLREVAMYVDTNTPGVNSLLRLATVSPAIRKLLESQVRLSTWIARKFGSSAGGIGYEIEDAGGHVAPYAMVSGTNSFVTAVAPAVLAARSIVEGRFPARGLVLPDRHVETNILLAFLESKGLSLTAVT